MINMKKKYKVVIIGAGPSGLSTAINLYKNGIKDILSDIFAE